MSISNENTLRIAIEAVAAACSVTRAAQQAREAFGSLTKDDRSPVTVADYAAQAIVAMTLQERLPDPREHALIGEEDSGDLSSEEASLTREGVLRLVKTYRPSADENAVLAAIDSGGHDGSGDSYWTLDPVDGTKGFLRGQQFAIALAKIENGEVQLGVMGCPGLPVDQATALDVPDPGGVIYAAMKGRGAWEFAGCDPDAEPMRISCDTWNASRPLRYCGSVEKAHGSVSDAARLIESLGGGERVAVDSQCKYAIVARGQSDAYLRMPKNAEYVEKIWDHGAGSIIAAEAGAVVSDIHGKSLDFGHGGLLKANSGVIVAVPGLHEQLISGIRELGLGPASEGDN
ncbi:MAG: 3'(2'),5'-bisphosphate nucleotidase [Phycisphaerae bacterium]|nr:3'(2'),5'-bisphosphate nucleotidase [Phycisphaerae bacterium]|tara:strand:+ start:393 stop:1427 length:1035 start_codon:yes stop_codon:yes gene_type:complete